MNPMPWVRFDDQYPIHRKVDGLSDAAFRLHTSAIFWSARNLTDGFVSREDLDGVSARVRTPARFAAECVRRGVWHAARTECASPKCPGPVDGDGWIVHDYWWYQPMKEKVTRDREAKAKRQERWLAKARSRKDASRDASQDASADSTPPRPEGGGGGGPPPSRPGAPPGAQQRADHRTLAEAALHAAVSPNGHPARGDTVHAIAAKARTAIRKDTP